MTDAIRLMLDVTAEEDGERLDRLIAMRAADISRSYAQQLIKEGHVKVGGIMARPATRVHTGEIIELSLPRSSHLRTSHQHIFRFRSFMKMRT